MAVVIGAFALAESVFDSDNPALQINDAADFTVVTTANGTFAYAAGVGDSGVSAFRLDADGTLTNIQNIQHSATVSLISTSLVTSATIGGRTFVYAMGGTGTLFSERLSTFEVGPSGELTYISSVGESWETGPILGGGAKMMTFTAGGKTYLYVRGNGFENFGGDMINVIELGENGSPVETFNALWSDNLAQDAVGITIGERTFLIEAIPAFLSLSGGIGSYEVVSDGTLLSSDGLGSKDNPEIYHPYDLAHAVVGGTDYVVVANLITKAADPIAFAVLKLDANGVLSPVSQYTGTANQVIQAASEVETFTVGGETFVAALGAVSNPPGMQLYVLRLDAAGGLTLVSQQQLPAGLFLEEMSIKVVDGAIVLVGTHLTSNAIHTLVLGAGADMLIGSSGNDNLLGLEGDDALNGGPGNDTLDGGAGNDTLNGGLGDDTMDGGDGIDTVDYSDRTEFIGVALEVNGALIGFSEADTIFNIENVTGGSGDDVLVGNEVGNALKGNGGADTLRGQGGNDTLEGGLGSDTLEGGSNDDTIIDGGADGSVNTVSGGNGDDILRNTAVGSGGSWDGGAGTDLLDLSGNTIDGAIFLGGGVFFSMAGTSFSNFESAYGTEGNNLILGSSFINTIDGRGGNDTLIGGFGNDTMDGGTGIDTASYAASAVTVSVTLNGATAVLATVGSVAEQDTLVNIENVEGGSWDDFLWGDSLANRLTGNAGHDDLNGQGGADVLVGGEGGDLLQGGDGKDTLQGGDGDDIISDGSADGSTNSVNGGAGNDLLVNTYVDFGGTWNGGAGIDTIDFSFDGLSGWTMDLAAINFVIWSTTFKGFENLIGSQGGETILGSDGINLLDGQGGNDTIAAGRGADTLLGGDGNDTLDGGIGTDAMTGGAGDDNYFVNASSDTVFEGVGEGTDTVFTAASSRLAAGQEIEQLTTTDKTGIARISLIGNEFANRLTGNAGNNTLDGGLGKDLLLGGVGNDLYIVDALGDRLFETMNRTSSVDAGGTDRVESSVSFSLDAYAGVRFVENLTLTGTSNIRATGNALDNRLTGNVGNNTLNGGLGRDVLDGGLGRDNFVFDSGLGGGNIDIITSFAVAQDTIRLENGIFSALTVLGTLADGAFNTGTAATEADDRIIYNSATKTLLYDADGLDGAAAIKFAILNNLTGDLSEADFVIL